MAKRFIKIYEQIINWEWFRYPDTLQLFVYLLVKANYKEGSFQGVKVGRGQYLTSLSKLGQATGQSIRQIRDNLKHLEMTGEVTSQTTNRYRIITIVRYDEYQKGDKQIDKQSDKQLDKQTTSKVTNKTATSIENIEIYKDRNIEGKFIPPTVTEISSYIKEIGSTVDPEYFYDHYAAVGWTLKGGQKMKDWKATLRNWERREKKNGPGKDGGNNQNQDRKPFADISARIPVL